ncbi:MAG: hypothetical protein MSS94_06790, partial [Clostridiales bacterium]|nr:hypothetical protein [Clostridiales bacterium]
MPALVRLFIHDCQKFPEFFIAKTPGRHAFRVFYVCWLERIFILFLDKMVNTILSCAFRAGRQWRREMYGLRFGAAMPLTARPRSHKTVFNRFMKN